MTTDIWTIILAAGESKRFNGVKALAEWGHETLLSHTIKTAEVFSGHRTLVVTGAYHDEIAAHLKHAASIQNHNWTDGMGSSIACGVSGVLERDRDVKYILVLTIDQPLVEQIHLEKLLQRSRETRQCVLTTDGTIDSPPVVIPKAYFAMAQTLKGDGLKKILPAYDRIENTAAVQDADTPENLVALSKASLLKA